MKKILAAVLSLMVLVSLGSGALAENKLEKILAAGKITVATSPDFAPMEFVDPSKTGQESYVGCDLALARYIAEKLGVELVIEAMEFSAVQGAITTGKVDLAISGFAYTPERAESMELSDPYNVEERDAETYQQGILIKKADFDTYKTFADFAGKKVAAQNASLQYNLLTSQIPDAKPEIITSLNDAVLMLITGKVDAVAASRENGEAFAANYPDLCMSQVVFDQYSEGNVVAVTKGETALMEKINEIIAEVNELNLFPQWKEEATALATSLGEDV